MKTKVVQKDGEEIVPAEIIAQSIVRIDNAVKAMNRAGLKRRAIVILLAKSATLNQSEIERVLDALEGLRKDYTTL